MDLRAQFNSVKRMVQRRTAMARAYQDLLGSHEGEPVLFDILRECGLLVTSHVEGDVNTTAYNEGKRAIGLFILNRLRWSEMEMLALARAQTNEALNEAEGEAT